MSIQQVQAVLGKAAVDSEFRKSLFENPDSALAEYDLSEDEKESLRNLEQEKLNALAESLDERLTKGWINTG